MVGQYDTAITKLEFLLNKNGNLTIELLKRDPFWDPLSENDAFKLRINNPKY